MLIGMAKKKGRRESIIAVGKSHNDFIVCLLLNDGT